MHKNKNTNYDSLLHMVSLLISVRLPGVKDRSNVLIITTLIK